MSNNKSIVDRVYTNAPCNADWDSMTGNDQVRFCQHCDLSVSDISTMTRRQAERLVSKSDGRLCLRYHRTLDGQIITAGSPGKLHQLTRRASRLAAGAFTVALTMSSIVMPRQSMKNAVGTSSRKDLKADDEPANSVQAPDSTSGLSLQGVIKDQNGSAVVGAKVFISSDQSLVPTETTSTEDGSFSFEKLSAGKYVLTVSARGFGRVVIKDIEIRPDQSPNLEVPLPFVSPIAYPAVAGGIGIALPVDLLVRTAMDNDVQGVKALLEVGLDVNKVDDRLGTTALYHAVENNNIELVNVLLGAGAEINGHPGEKKSGEPGSAVVSPSLLGIGYKTSLELVEILLAAGADVNIKDTSGVTPLMTAAQVGNKNILQRLIDAGANLNDTDDGGNTALTMAVQSNEIDSVQTLINSGAKVDHRGAGGKTALMSLDGEASPDLVRLLLDSKASINLKSDDGQTALQNAAEIDNVEILNILIRAGAKIDDPDIDGSTALMKATAIGNLENVRTLIAAGANINFRDKDGKTALAQAIEANTENSHKEVIELLKGHGAVE